LSHSISAEIAGFRVRSFHKNVKRREAVCTRSDCGMIEIHEASGSIPQRHEPGCQRNLNHVQQAHCGENHRKVLQRLCGDCSYFRGETMSPGDKALERGAPGQASVPVTSGKIIRKPGLTPELSTEAIAPLPCLTFGPWQCQDNGEKERGKYAGSGTSKKDYCQSGNFRR